MNYIVTFLLFLLQFVVLPFGVSQFETPKVLLAEVLIALLLLFTFSQNGVRQFFSNRLQVLLFLVLVFLNLSHLLFQRTDISFLGNAFRMQGVFLLWLLLGFSLVSTKIALPKVPLIFFVVLLLVQFVFSFFVVSNTDRAIGTLGEPNALAASVIFLWPWTIKSYKLEGISSKLKREHNNKNFLAVFSAFIALLIILLSGSRSGVVAFVIQCIFLAFLYFKVDFNKAAFVGLFLVVFSLLLPFFQSNTPYENRAELWKTALIAGYKYPLLGWGFGNTEIAMKEYGWKLYTGSHDYYVDSAHNFLLDWWIQGGFIGHAVILLLLYISFRNFEQRKDRLLLTLFLGIVTVMLFNPVSVVTLIQFWWLIGNGLEKKYKSNQYV